MQLSPLINQKILSPLLYILTLVNVQRVVDDGVISEVISEFCVLELVLISETREISESREISE